MNAITTLLNRVFSLTSDFNLFHKEAMFLKSFFNNNGFNDTIFSKYIRNLLKKKKITHQVTISGPKKQTLFLSFPYISIEISKVLQKALLAIFRKYLPQIDLKLAIYNNYKIKSFLKCKEELPTNLCSSIVYLFSIPNCSLSYICSVMKNLCLRVDQHRGVSTRTEKTIVKTMVKNILCMVATYSAIPEFRRIYLTD